MSQKRFSLQIDAAIKTMSSLKNQIILPMDIVHSLLRDGKKRFVFILVDSVQSAGGAFVVGKIIRYVASWMTDFGPSFSLPDFLCGLDRHGAGGICALGFPTEARVHPAPKKLDGQKIFRSRDPLVRLIVFDMDGHGRALEILWDVLSAQRETWKGLEILANGSVMKSPAWSDEVPLSKIVGDVLVQLSKRYSKMFVNIHDWLPLFQAILVGRKFSSPTALLGNNVPLDHYLSAGLIRWDPSTQRVTCAFVWLCFAANENQDICDLLQSAEAYQATQRDSSVNPVKFAMAANCWMHFDEFVARFQAMKSKVFAGSVMRWREYQSEACLGQGESPFVKVQALQCATATRRIETKMPKLPAEIPCEHLTLVPGDLLKHNYYH